MKGCEWEQVLAGSPWENEELTSVTKQTLEHGVLPIPLLFHSSTGKLIEPWVLTEGPAPVFSDCPHFLSHRMLGDDKELAPKRAQAAASPFILN